MLLHRPCLQPLLTTHVLLTRALRVPFARASQPKTPVYQTIDQLTCVQQGQHLHGRLPELFSELTEARTRIAELERVVTGVGTRPATPPTCADKPTRSALAMSRI